MERIEEGLKAAGSDRRTLLKGMLLVTAVAVISPAEAWGLAATGLKPATLETLIALARDIYPHDRVPDRFYAIAIKDFDGKAAKDAKLAALLEGGVADLDARAKTAGAPSYTKLARPGERVAILKAIETSPFFQTIRGSLVTGLYNQKAVWPLFGYEGASADKGGYIQRGFDDLTWL